MGDGVRGCVGVGEEGGLPQKTSLSFRKDPRLPHFFQMSSIPGYTEAKKPAW